MLKQIKEKLGAWIDKDKMEMALDIAVVTVIYGVLLMMVTELILLMVKLWLFMFSKNTIMSVWEFCQKFNLF